EKLFALLEPKPWYRRHPLLAILLPLLLVAMIYSGFKAESDEELSVSEASLGLVEVQGTITDIREQLKWIRKLEHASEIKGVLLRVDSPGGGASASEELYQALAHLGQVKPLVVSMGATAASGGLMISMAGERIFANASTITGSIGVRMDIPQLQVLLEKVGVNQETLTTGPYKDAGSMLRPLSPAERSYFLGILQDLHQQFIEIIVKKTHKSEEEIKKIAEGRIFTGREALSLGLVDEIGGQEDAHRYLSQKTGVRLEKKLITKPKKSKWVDEVLDALGQANFWDEVKELFRPNSSQPLFQMP
ncbi:MAG: signal peptide peptidase SppA, partial [Desulfovibrio sp.]|nr:signal peptide peptidase SppA [Desulfovibrio sp.]